jgi:MFS family permease
MLIAAALMGIGIGLAFAALGNLVVQAVPPSQTGAATGMNTVMRTLGGALGGQIVATFIANNVAHGLPTVTGFTDSFVLEAAFLVICTLAGTLVPVMREERAATVETPREPKLAQAQEVA